LHVRLNAGRCLLTGFRANEKKRGERLIGCKIIPAPAD
jgi:hypothetical protein